MKVLVCGGRDFADADLLEEVLDGVHDGEEKISLVVHGGCSGADTLAGKWAKRRGVKCVEVKAHWFIYGRRAGPIRNQKMLDEYKPDCVFAFPGGGGTQDMIDRACAAGVATFMVERESK